MSEDPSRGDEAFRTAFLAALDARGVPPDVVFDLETRGDGLDWPWSFDSSVPNMVCIRMIEVPEELRGERWASVSLDLAVALADLHGVTLVGTLATGHVDGEGLGVEELAGWYGRRRFTLGDNWIMRPPRPAPAAEPGPGFPGR